jgi:hypothetical protein
VAQSCNHTTGGYNKERRWARASMTRLSLHLVQAAFKLLVWEEPDLWKFPSAGSSDHFTDVIGTSLVLLSTVPASGGNAAKDQV